MQSVREGSRQFLVVRVLLIHKGTGVALGGAIALLGAMCYAELASAHPHAGGTYVYLSKSLGKGVGFAFAWSAIGEMRLASPRRLTSGPQRSSASLRS